MRSLAGRYRVEQPVGEGGSAVVHSGYDRTLKRRVAIKLFTPYRPDSPAPSVDVLREARAAAALSHPNIARVYDYGEATEDGKRVPYLVMEFLEGDTVADQLATTGAFDWPRAAEICADVAAALAAAHARDLVHRDVKPRNVMLTPSGTKVLDFGIAAMAGQDGFDSQGQLWGTPASLAPEQLRGEPTYPAADIYALGLLLFECLTGDRAWPGTSVGEILAARHQQRAPRLPSIPGLPRSIVRLYESCVADDPARRPSALEVVQVLRIPALRSSTVITRTIAPVRPKRSRSRAAITASIAVAAAFVSIIGLQVANGYSTPGGREAEAAVDGAPATKAPQPITTPAPKPTSTRVVPISDGDNDRPVRRVTDTPTREATSQVRPVKPKPTPSSAAPSTKPTTRPPGPVPSDPTPTTTEPEPEPTDPPATTEPPAEPTETPPADPDPEDPPPADESVVLAGLSPGA
ncbi:serine/threonine-protein kinase [Actinoplanes friuliensis]|uniref:non-specific serine/threonine protein kinase n=1 Tax=Actinoplanes friuliensis DSM 7358 TaxID=1246995 RepID=U5W4T1_9ACTN|nr:serine/threonine-protein kinase [Actinoplanes friuliensis]AGZ44017.1 serine/threonine protein kinase [Actinoplanes friuliensis DSM 7358]